MNDFGDYFIKILEKLSTDLPIIINLYEHEKVAENRLINKKCEVDYDQFSRKTVTLINSLLYDWKVIRNHVFLTNRITQNIFSQIKKFIEKIEYLRNVYN